MSACGLLLQHKTDELTCCGEKVVARESVLVQFAVAFRLPGLVF